MAISDFDFYLLTERTAKILSGGKKMSITNAFGKAARGLGIRHWSSQAARKDALNRVSKILAERSAKKATSRAKQKVG